VFAVFMILRGLAWLKRAFDWNPAKNNQLVNLFEWLQARV
jgi:hypothetical protein